MQKTKRAKRNALRIKTSMLRSISLMEQRSKKSRETAQPVALYLRPDAGEEFKARPSRYYDEDDDPNARYCHFTKFRPKDAIQIMILTGSSWIDLKDAYVPPGAFKMDFADSYTSIDGSFVVLNDSDPCPDPAKVEKLKSGMEQKMQGVKWQIDECSRKMSTLQKEADMYESYLVQLRVETVRE